MRSVLLAVTWVLAVQQVSAQLIVDLTPHQAAVPGLKATITKVVTAFDPLSVIGTARTEETLPTLDILLSGPVDTEILGLIERGGVSEGASLQVYMKMNELHLAIKPGTHRKYVECQLKAEFYKAVDKDFMRLYVGAAGVSRSAERPEDELPLLIKEAVAQCLEDFARAIDRDKLRHELVPGDVMRRLSGESFVDHPIFSVTRPKPGLYRTYEDFCKDRPDTSGAVVLRHTTPTTPERRRLRKAGVPAERDTLYAMELVSDGDTDLVRSAWGCSDGERLFVNVDGRFRWLWRDDRLGYYFNYYATEDHDAMAGAVVGGVMFGLVGAAVVLALDAADQPGEQPFYLDARTGKFSMNWGTFPGPASSRTLFQFSRFSKHEGPVRIEIAGEKDAELTPDAYAMTKLVPRTEPVIATLHVDGHEPVPVKIDASKPELQIYLIQLSKDGTPRVSRAGYTMVSTLLDRLDPELNRTIKR